MNSFSNAPSEPASGSIKTLLQELRSEGTRLFQQEAALVKAEIGEKISSLVNHVSRIGVGSAVMYAGAILVLFGVADLVGMLMINSGVDAATAAWVARLSVGVVVALIGWIMFAQARKAVKSDDLVPDQTLRTLRENKQWMQNKLENSHEPN